MIFLIFVLFTRTLYNSIHAVQSFFFGTLHFVVYPRKKMPACPHLVSVEEINAEEIRRKMTEVSNLVSIQNDYSFCWGNQFFAWSWWTREVKKYLIWSFQHNLPHFIVRGIIASATGINLGVPCPVCLEWNHSCYEGSSSFVLSIFFFAWRMEYGTVIWL